MVFKLVRIDAEDPFKVPLTTGKCTFGRGKFLDCEDKRVSRNHGELTVTNDEIILKALHQNPCFITKKGNKEVQILNQDSVQTLNNGDRFGLLPTTYWYEVLHYNLYTNDEPEVNEYQNNTCANETVVTNSEKPEELTETEVCNETDNIGQLPSPSLLLNQDLPNDAEPGANGETTKVIEGLNDALPSPSVIQDQQLLDNNNANEGEPTTQNADESSTQNADEPTNQSLTIKRSHSTDTDELAKKVKIEPNTEDETEESKPGPSNDQQASSSGDDTKDIKPTLPDNTPNKQVLRERCMYGASCYRRNPAHKAQYSHPTDADWGAGDRGQCPYGASCRRTNPRHWLHHEHPPGTHPPANAPGRTKKRVRKQRQSESSSNSEADEDLIVTGKRNRKTIKREQWSDSESNSDPYKTDSGDEWAPSQSVNTQDFESQD